MYCYGPLFTASEKLFEAARVILILARRQARTRPYPLEQSSLGIAYGAAGLHVGWSVPAHACLREPGQADAKELACLLRRKQPLSVGMETHFGDAPAQRPQTIAALEHG